MAAEILCQHFSPLTATSAHTADCSHDDHPVWWPRPLADASPPWPCHCWGIQSLLTAALLPAGHSVTAEISGWQFKPLAATTAWSLKQGSRAQWLGLSGRLMVFNVHLGDVPPGVPMAPAWAEVESDTRLQDTAGEQVTPDFRAPLGHPAWGPPGSCLGMRPPGGGMACGCRVMSVSKLELPLCQAWHLGGTQQVRLAAAWGEVAWLSQQDQFVF